MWEELPAEEKMHEDEEIELSDFLEADERLVTGGVFTLEEMLLSEEPVESEDDAEVEEEIVPSEAQRAWKTVRKFLHQRSGKTWVQACDQLYNEMREISKKIAAADDS